MKYNVEIQAPCSPVDKVVRNSVKLALQIEVQLQGWSASAFLESLVTFIKN